MPNPNALVATVDRFEPALERFTPDEVRRVGGVSVVFAGDRRLRIEPANPRAAGMAQILDGLRKIRTPVYIEFEPATSAITRIEIPNVTRVLAVRPGSDGTLTVEIAYSHGAHQLSRNSTDFAELEAALGEALRSHELVVLTETDSHEIIDVRPYVPGPEGPPIPFPEVTLPGPTKRSKRTLMGCLPWGWLCWLIPWFCCISYGKAQQAFNAMAATSCDPTTVPPPCIPFLYPDDGCWARAHEMYRLMLNMGLRPNKVWIQGSYSLSLHPSTRNNPSCSVRWNWHVAPTLCVRKAWFQTVDMVIDPSLFNAPVDEPTWKGVQNDPAATLTPTDGSIYYLWGMLTDPTYSLTNHYLAIYRAQLQNRSLVSGPPPYAYCP